MSALKHLEEILTISVVWASLFNFSEEINLKVHGNRRAAGSGFKPRSRPFCIFLNLVLIYKMVENARHLPPSLDHHDPIRPQPRVLAHSCISFARVLVYVSGPSTGWQFLSSGRLACDWSDSAEVRGEGSKFEQRS